MPILFTTYGLLLIFSLLGYAQLRTYKTSSFVNQLAYENFARMRQNLVTNLDKRAKKARPKPPMNRKVVQGQPEEELEEEPWEIERDSLLPDEAPRRERRTSHLHVNALFSTLDASIHDGKGKACASLLQSLISELYAGQPFFERAKKQYPDLEEQLVTTLYMKAQDDLKEKKRKKIAAKQLLKLDLDDETLNYVFYKMLNGTKSLVNKDAFDAPGYYYLDDIVSIRPNDKLMSLWLAPKPLLMALFQNENLVEEVIDARKEIYNERRKRVIATTPSTMPTNTLETRFKAYITLIDPQYIDFGISTTPPPSENRE